MADTQTGKLPELGARRREAAAERSATTSETLRCQWCMVDLPAGATVCPNCGSAGIDPSMTAPDTAPPVSEAELLVEPQPEDELVEWWNDADEATTYKSTSSEPQSQMPVILGLLGTAAVCVILGVVVAPIALASVFESSLGVTIENHNDLRPLGGIIGLLVGAFIGAIGMWIAAPRR